MSAGQQRDNATVAFLQSDQAASVEHRPRHYATFSA